MTGAELIGCAVYDVHGQLLGKVHDLRFAAGAPDDGDAGSPAYRLVALECGGVGLAHRLGYTRRELAGPWLLTVVLRWLVRHSRVVPYSAVERIADRRVDIGLAAGDLRPAGVAVEQS